MIVRKRNPVNFITLLIFIFLNIFGLFASKIKNALNLSDYSLYLILNVIAFLLPILFITFLNTHQKKIKAKNFLKLKNIKLKWLPLTICMGTAATLGSVILNSFVTYIFGTPATNNFITPIGELPFSNIFSILTVIIIVPAVLEELYFRGAYIGQYGTNLKWDVILSSSILFAMLHSSPYNVLGPLLSGITFAVLIFITNSVISAIIAHAINNIICCIVWFYAETINQSGLKNLFFVMLIVMFFVFLYLSLRFLEPYYSKFSKSNQKRITVSESRKLRVKRINPWTPSFFIMSLIWLVKIIFQFTGFWG